MCDKQLLLKALFPLVFQFFHNLTGDEHSDRVLFRTYLVYIPSSGSALHLVVFDYLLHQQVNFLQQSLSSFYLEHGRALQMSLKIPYITKGRTT